MILLAPPPPPLQRILATIHGIYVAVPPAGAIAGYVADHNGPNGPNGPNGHHEMAPVNVA